MDLLIVLIVLLLFGGGGGLYWGKGGGLGSWSDWPDPRRNCGCLPAK